LAAGREIIRSGSAFGGEALARTRDLGYLLYGLKTARHERFDATVNYAC
jgi:hypothetical protein